MRNSIFIWWVSYWDMFVVDSIDEEVDRGNREFTSLPGHIKLLLRGLRSRDTFKGQLITPVTLDSRPVIDYLTEDVTRLGLLKHHVGIAFEEVHLQTLSKYPGIITNLDIELVE